jgi:hypothetical protein
MPRFLEANAQVQAFAVDNRSVGVGKLRVLSPKCGSDGVDINEDPAAVIVSNSKSESTFGSPATLIEVVIPNTSAAAVQFTDGPPLFLP